MAIRGEKTQRSGNFSINPVLRSNHGLQCHGQAPSSPVLRMQLDAGKTLVAGLAELRCCWQDGVRQTNNRQAATHN
jgi:hypothetical protein